jgi:hypothetical protein
MGPTGKNKCFFCDLINYSGIIVLKHFICCDCQKDIVHTHDGKKYSFYCSKIKKIWGESLNSG